MEFVQLLMQQALSSLCDPTLRQIGYLLHAKKNVEDMSSTMKDLKAKRSDIQKAIEDAKREQKRSTHDVERWLEKVVAIEDEVTTIVTDYNGRGCLVPGGCSLNCWSSYKAGRLAAKKNAELLKLISNGDSFKDDVATPLSPVRVQEMPTTSAALGMGFKSNLERVHTYLNDDNVGIVGIWGMGGVGKSFLLQAVNNDFLPPVGNGTEKVSFDHVIWVVVSKEFSLERIQEDIAVRLGLRLPNVANPVSTATTIFNYLKNKDFLLLMDDLWDAVNLANIGIPDPHRSMNINIGGGVQHKQKVLFTTRDEKVCADMRTQRSIKVECLELQEAWQLFRENAGEAIDMHPIIKICAEKIVHKCGGLPLALILLGRAMSIKKTREEWEYAVTSLQKSRLNIIAGMQESILPSLKFSYDNLQSDTLRECFLCCSLWPEDADISKEELIECWMGIGLIIINDFDDIGEAFDHGHFIIGLLKEACFLEYGKKDEDKNVKLHDVVRELALWISTECGCNKNRWIVQAGANFAEASLEKWRSADRISLMHSGIGALPPCPPLCPNLSVLILKGTPLKMIPPNFFQCMPALIYLDLSSTHVTELPREISCLVNLQYLNLSSTRFHSLPMEFRFLTNLKYLILRHTQRNLSMPSGLVSSLPMLQFLDLYPDAILDPREVKCLEGQIKALGIAVTSFENFQEISHLPVRWLRVTNLQNLHFHLLNYRMCQSLQMLRIWKCDKLEELVLHGSGQTNSFPRLEVISLYGLKELQQISWGSVSPSQCLQKLRELNIWYCHGLKHLNWVLQLPSLVKLTVVGCKGMEQLIVANTVDELVEEDSTKPSFSRLKELFLRRLRNLSSISMLALAFPSLTSLDVRECPQLKKLPFKLEIINNLRRITGTREWWDELDWDDGAVKSSISRCFISVR